MADLEELAGRVEGLTGPDRRIDMRIHEAVGLSPKVGTGPFDWHEDTYRPGDWAQSEFNQPAPDKRISAPAYTASIDAAMTLIEAESWIEIKGPRKYLNIPTPVPNKWSASVAQWNHEGEGIGWGATPALTLTAAALRALSRTQGNQNG